MTLPHCLFLVGSAGIIYIACNVSELIGGLASIVFMVWGVVGTAWKVH